MPFIGVLPERANLFHPEPKREVAVNDATAWRLYPRHRHLYDKLALALDAGLIAAPCGVSPLDCGIGPATLLFVKPIINLAGMAVRARAVMASEVPGEPGSFWCERLQGAHTSTDCLVQEGRAVWFAHTRGSDAKHRERPRYWDVGVDLPELEPRIAHWIERHLDGYTGICNLEMIGGRPIEVHLRGSNSFFDLYGPGFMPAWVDLVDGRALTPPPPIPGGLVISVFGDRALTPEQTRRLSEAGLSIQIDPHTPDRVAILRATDKAAALSLCGELGLL